MSNTPIVSPSPESVAWISIGVHAFFPSIDFDRFGGQVGLIADIGQFALLADAVVSEAAASLPDDESFPGVIAYEVYEPFGAYLGDFAAERGNLPSCDVAREWLVPVATSFFSR